jgi:hypothetical protein
MNCSDDDTAGYHLSFSALIFLYTSCPYTPFSFHDFYVPRQIISLTEIIARFLALPLHRTDYPGSITQYLHLSVPLLQIDQSRTFLIF